MIFGFAREHHAVHENPGHLDLPGVETVPVGQALHLRDHQAATVADRHRDRLGLQGEGLTFHREVAVGIGGGGPDDADIDGKGLVEEVLLVVDRQDADEVGGRPGVELSATVAWIDERAETHPGERARLAGRDVAIEMADHALRQVPGLHPVLDGERLQPGNQAPVPADDPCQQALVAEVVEAAFAAVALAGRVDQGEIARMGPVLLAGRIGARAQEAFFERDRDALGEADAHEAAGGHGVAVADKAHRRGCAHQFAGVALAEVDGGMRSAHGDSSDRCEPTVCPQLGCDEYRPAVAVRC